MEIEPENSEPVLSTTNNACRNHRDSNREKKLLDRLSRHDSDSHEAEEHSSRDENGRKNSKKMIALATVTFVFFIVELTAGLLNGSVALLADSYHMLSDVMALFIALICLRLSMRKSKKSGFGWVRAEVFGAVVNAVFLLSTCFLITLEACERIFHPKPMSHPDQVLIVGIIGLIINLIGMALLHGSHGGHGHSHGGSGGHGHSHGGGGHGHSHAHSRHREDPLNAGEALELCSQEDVESKATRPSRSMSHLSNTCSHNHLAMRFVMEESEANGEFDSDDSADAADIAMRRIQEQENLNMRGLFLHIVSDAIGSVFVIITASLALFFSDFFGKALLYFDPALSLVLVTLIFYSTFPLVCETADVILGRSPKFIDQKALKKDVAKVQGVAHVGAISIWTLVASRHLATAEIIFCNAAVYEEALPKLRKLFHGMGIHSLTVDPIFSQEKCDISETKAISEEHLCEASS